MKIFVLLLFPLASLAQDTLYTTSLKNARLLVRDAMRARVLDSINQENIVRITMMGKEYDYLQVKFGQAQENFKQRLRTQAESNQILTETNQGLTVEVKQLRKVNVGWKIGTGLGAAAAVYFAAKAAENN